jgi:flagellar protein FliL
MARVACFLLDVACMSGAAAESPAAAGGGGGGGGGGSNKALIIVVLVFNVLIAAGLGYQVLMGQAKGAQGQIKGGDDHAKEKEPAGPKFGPLIEVGALVANLSGPLSGHYAKVFMHLEATDEKTKPRIEEALVPIRAEALLYLNGLDIKDASGQAQIRTMSEELKVKLNALVGKNTIRRVYFSEFVIQ